MSSNIQLFHRDCMEAMKEMPDKALLQRQKKAKRSRLWYVANREKRIKKCNEYRVKNKDAYNRYRNEYRKKNPKGIYDCIKQGAKKRKIEMIMTQKEFCDWYLAQDRSCFYCKRNEADVVIEKDIIQVMAHRLTIDRCDNKVGYSIGNIVLCCSRCNTVKGNYFTKNEMLLIGNIIWEKHNAV